MQIKEKKQSKKLIASLLSSVIILGSIFPVTAIASDYVGSFA